MEGNINRSGEPYLGIRKHAWSTIRNKFERAENTVILHAEHHFLRKGFWGFFLFFGLHFVFNKSKKCLPLWHD